MEIVLVGINPNDINDRPVFDTGLSTVGRGGDDYFCAHCGHKMMTSFNMARLELDIVFKCGSCGGHNISPDLEGRTAETAVKDEIPLHDPETGESDGGGTA